MQIGRRAVCSAARESAEILDGPNADPVLRQAGGVLKVLDVVSHGETGRLGRGLFQRALGFFDDALEALERRRAGR